MTFYKLSNDTLVSVVSVFVKKIFTKNHSDIHYFLTDFSNGFIPGSLPLCGKKLLDAFADYHQDMNANAFENWFLEKLIPNLLEKLVVILNNASYYCRQVDKIPNMNRKKAEMLDFMKRNSITVPEPLPTKPVLLELIKMANIQKKFVIDSIAFENGHLQL